MGALKRRYMINVNGTRKFPLDTLTGDVMVTAHDAATNYVFLWMPGFKLLSVRYSCVKTTKQAGCHFLFIGSAFNAETRKEKILYIREIDATE